MSRKLIPEFCPALRAKASNLMYIKVLLPALRDEASNFIYIKVLLMKIDRKMKASDSFKNLSIILLQDLTIGPYLE